MDAHLQILLSLREVLCIAKMQTEHGFSLWLYNSLSTNSYSNDRVIAADIFSTFQITLLACLVVLINANKYETIYAEQNMFVLRVVSFSNQFMHAFSWNIIWTKTNFYASSVCCSATKRGVKEKLDNKVKKIHAVIAGQVHATLFAAIEAPQFVSCTQWYGESMLCEVRYSANGA